MEIKNVSLEKTPEILQKAVNDYIESISKYGKVVLLTVEEKIDTPYKDKTIKSIGYTVFLEYGNLLTTISWSDMIKNTINKNSMIVGEVTTFIKHSKFMKLSAEMALKE